MKIEIRTKQVKYNVYIASDGKEFSCESDAEEHERILNGDKKVCVVCKGEGLVNGRYQTTTWNYGHSRKEMWITDDCPECEGKGYLEKKWV